MRIGILSTARINALGIILPSRKRYDVDVIGVASRSKEHATTYARKFNIPKVFNTYQDLIESPDIDAVYLSLPNVLHFPYAKKCLEHKKHVLCEKPATLHLQELETLENIANQNNCYFLDAMHYYLYPAIQTIMKDLQYIKDDIQYIEAFLGFPKPPDGDIRLNHTLGGGAHNHLSCYLTHFITWLFPKKEWDFKLFDKKIYNDVDIERSFRLKSIEKKPILFDSTVSFQHDTIDSWILLKWQQYYLKIKHAFTPTTFFNKEMPYKNIFDVQTNHPLLATKNYFFEGMKTTYDYQLDYFIKYTKGHVTQGIFKKAYQLFEQTR